MRKFYSVLFCSILLTCIAVSFSSCSDSFEETYGGVWNVIFEGEYSGTAIITVAADGSFDDDIVFNGTLGIGTITNPVTGTVAESGEINGIIFMNGNQIGTLSGDLRDNQTGTGVYDTSFNDGGTWVALKQ